MVRKRNSVKPHPLLAMDVNDDAGCLNARVARTFIASRLAPTVNPVHLQVTGRLSGRLNKHQTESSSSY